MVARSMAIQFKRPESSHLREKADWCQVQTDPCDLEPLPLPLTSVYSKTRINVIGLFWALEKMK